MALLLAVSALLLAAFASACSAEQAEQRRLPPRFFGVNGQLLLQAETARPGGRLVSRSLERIEGLGIEFVRANLIWPEIEPTAPVRGRHRYDFSGLDAWVGALARRGLRWQALVMGIPTPDWAGATPACGFRSAPARPADLAALAGKIARRYGRKGSFWQRHPKLKYRPVTDYEIWNEPNHGAFWCPAPVPEDYTDLLVASAAKIRAHDPRADLLSAGLADFMETSPPGTALPKMSTAEFVARMAAHHPGLAGVIDVAAIHFYAEDPSSILAQLSRFRAILDGAGLGSLPISVNEVGWATKGSDPDYVPPVPEPVRARYMAEVTDAIARSPHDVVAIAPHTWISAEASPFDNEGWFGIADPVTGRPYRTARAYGERIGALRRDRR